LGQRKSLKYETAYRVVLRSHIVRCSRRCCVLLSLEGTKRRVEWEEGRNEERRNVGRRKGGREEGRRQGKGKGGGK
jgi:hypothetical protein